MRSSLTSDMPVSPVFMLSPTADLATGAAAEDHHAGPEDHAHVDEDTSVPPPPAPHAQARRAKPLPDIKEPTAEEVAQHSLTHLPYRRWCRWCVRARMLNFPHRKLPPLSRSSPLFVMDYAFIKHDDANTFSTVLIGRTYPSRAVFAVPCSQKRP